MYLSSIGSSTGICTLQADQNKVTTVEPPLPVYYQQLNRTLMNKLLVTFSKAEATDGDRKSVV